MYEQMDLDLRLNYERNLKDNLTNVARFAGEQQRQELAESGCPLKKVESKQEGYGIAAQAYVKVAAKHKTLKGEMDDFLKLLDGDGDATRIAGTLYNAALELAQEAILMAAQASRILMDLYYEEPRMPLEDFMDAEETGEEYGEEEAE